MPTHRVYVEPFGGAASVLMRKPQSHAEIYNDLDGDVVNLFNVLRSERAQELVQRITLTPFARDEFQAAYGQSDDPIERAAFTIIRSFMGHGSDGALGKTTGFRANSNRSGTTPAQDWQTYPAALRLVIERLRGVVIENRPALDVIEKHDTPQTLFYIDPPYLHRTRAREHRKNYRHEMSHDDHEELLDRLASITGFVIVSGYPDTLYDERLNGWNRRSRRTYADGAAERIEVIWMNFDPDRAPRHASPLDVGLFA